MQNVLIAVCCCISYGVTAQSPNTVPTQAHVSQPQFNWEEFTSSHQALKEAAKANNEKFTCVLNLLKTALSEELKNSQCQITEETTEESAVPSLNSILDKDQMEKENNEEIEKQSLTRDNEIDPENALYQKIVTKIVSAFSKPQNMTSTQNNTEVPSMIPIFRPRNPLPRNEINQNIPDFNSAPFAKRTQKSRAISFVPEKIIQTKLSPTSSPVMFNIPCQRAADVLDMTNIAVPKEAVCTNVNVIPKVNPVIESPKPKVPNQISPVTLSVNCADSDETVAMLFKPKNISLMQLYGNLLKKITITVLVPYHMSKLGGK